jgi:hypothetical protein
MEPKTDAELAEMYHQWFLNEKKRADWLYHDKRAIIKQVGMAVAEIKRFERRMDLIKKGLRDLDAAFETAQERRDAKA